MNKTVLGLMTFVLPTLGFALPKGFVYLTDVDPSIVQEIRYAGDHNFVGRPIKGYEKATCILTAKAAKALKNVQASLKKENLSLKVYDCYRPQMAVDDFYQWSENPNQTQMKVEFYPNVEKSQLFKQGYIARKSEHTMGSTLDLTIVPIPTPKQASFTPGQKLEPCYAPLGIRFKDNSIDMGTGFDCLDPHAHVFSDKISERAKKNRLLLRKLMIKNGFEPYDNEWWHFTLKDQPYPNQFFNFPVK